MIRKLIIATLPMAVMAGAAEARTIASMYEERGYQKCSSAFDQEVRNPLTIDRDYLINRTENRIMFYINGSEWTREGRSDVRMACETPARGHRILSARVEPGHFQPSTRVTVELAKN